MIGVTLTQMTKLKAKFRAIAHASSVQEANNAYRDLNALESYVGSRAQRYFEETWWKAVECWS